MSVGYSNNRFDWCDELYEVKANYNSSECCDIVKKHIAQFAGADKNFVKDICSRNNKSFNITKYYFPVYSINATVTYDWDEESVRDKGDFTVMTTTHHTNQKTFNKCFYSGIYDSCAPDVWVGRNDERFYTLSHVDDLDGGLYNEHCVYSQSEMLNRLNSCCSQGKPNSEAQYLINSWTATAIMVPIAVVSYQYNGKTFKSVINLHNGRFNINYLVSQSVERLAKKARTASVILRIAGVLFTVLAFFLIIKQFWSFAISVLSIVLFSIWAVKIRHPKTYFRNIYGEKGEKFGIKALKTEIWFLIFSVFVSLLLIIIF